MDNYTEKMIVSGDVYLVIKSMKQVGWGTIRETSVNRILYMSAVVYSFRFPEKENMFQNDYHFFITLSGPEETLIQGALVNLESNEIIEHTEEGYRLVELKESDNFSFLPRYAEKKAWIEDMAYIIGIYGEDKIYDFIFRDPEYKTSLDSNNEYNLDIGVDNQTIKFLNQFKKMFEDQTDGATKLDNRKYLELYFEYVFGRILRGE